MTLATVRADPSLSSAGRTLTLALLGLNPDKI
jgi:hypothetical protein